VHTLTPNPAGYYPPCRHLCLINQLLALLVVIIDHLDLDRATVVVLDLQKQHEARRKQ
jgi:hypothetical protein